VTCLQTWLSALETTDVKSLLYMLYLANDVVQNKRAGGADVYMSEFKRVSNAHAFPGPLLGLPAAAS
jgi:hypothetical protein